MPAATIGSGQHPNNEECGIRDVWAHNLEEEFRTIRQIVQKYQYVAMDTEFPGVVARPIGEFRSSADYQYQMLRCNVDLLRIIQLGLTFLDDNGKTPGGSYTTWQFNFKFNLQEDMYAQDSIDLLTNSGIQFKKHEDEGIEPLEFAELLMTSGIVLMDNIKWLSFHSGYDFGYLIKLLTDNNLPQDETEFFELLKLYFPTIYDVKIKYQLSENTTHDANFINIGATKSVEWAMLTYLTRRFSSYHGKLDVSINVNVTIDITSVFLNGTTLIFCTYWTQREPFITTASSVFRFECKFQRQLDPECNCLRKSGTKANFVDTSSFPRHDEDLRIENINFVHFTDFVAQILIKYLMKSCKNLKGGLQEVAEQLDLERIGPQHQAGSDSLLTGMAFFKMKEMFFEDTIDDSKFSGHLYGLGTSFAVNGATNSYGTDNGDNTNSS